MSVGTNLGLTLSTPYGSVGTNVGIGSQGGADIDVSASPSISRNLSKDVSGSVSLGIGTGFNSRQGLKDLNFNVSHSAAHRSTERNADGTKSKSYGKRDNSFGGGDIYGSSVQIGLQNFVPIVTNSSAMNSLSFQIKAGGELFGIYPSLFINASWSELSYDTNGTRKAYGYLYSEHAGDSAIMDFSRDKDGVYNRTLSNLPPSSSTYDVYSVSGQGTGGSFRPFRNDIGSFFDPTTGSSTSSDDVQIEFGGGNLFEVGGDGTFYENSNVCGPWKKINYGGERMGKLYEKVFFKAAGELTYNYQQDNNALASSEPVYVAADGASVIGKSSGSLGSLPQIVGGETDRTTRANLISCLTADEASVPDIAQTEKLWFAAENPSGNSRFFDPVMSNKNRSADNHYELRKHQLSEFTQTLPDGRRYIYGLPALNHMSREVSFSVNESGGNLSTGLTTFSPGSDDVPGNQNGRDKYYNSVTTPAYAHSYLLTSVLSSDYVDITGDGASDDDLGTFVKFNYKLWNDDYRWRAPYQSNLAQYNPGFYSDTKDGKGSYVVGSRQVMQLRTVESKNFIAEFYVSERNDGKGATNAVLPTGSQMRMPTGASLTSTVSAGSSYKLDSIKLFNKHDRYLNENNAVPIKTVIFRYDYELCKGIPNTSNTAQGKLTLKQIYFRYGNSDKGLLSPYTFSYQNANPDYAFDTKDRWGNYKPTDPGVSNYEFPYSAQSGSGVTDAAAWNLTNIKLPSGGKLTIEYECKDYAFVQNKRAMQMFRTEGFGAGPNKDNKDFLYADKSNINDYVYFKREIAKETPGLSLRDNYLEGQDLLYYSFNLDITGNGRYENIKSYAKVSEVNVCPNNSNYGYIKLERDDAGNMKLHPATIYGLNTARYYLPHILYPGADAGSSLKDIVMGLVDAGQELGAIFQNPFELFISKGKARKVKIERSWVRLHAPGLKKKGGGVRVKQLTLDNNWSAMSGIAGQDASYGKTYDYTIQDLRYGKISSGVASYEPQIGGDENPFHKPAESYQAAGGRLLPSIDFFQEEPFGENFFPTPVVGYSSVKVRSIHISEGKSSQNEEEYLYYTAKDFPIEVNYTSKVAPGQSVAKSLRHTSRKEHVLQGYTLQFNDMHGKPKGSSNYVLTQIAGQTNREKITGEKYNYVTDGSGSLSGKVRALIRTRGQGTYELKDNVQLGREVDFSIDSRSCYFRSFSRKVQLNVNGSFYGIFLVIVPTGFFPDKEEEQLFQTMVSTKIVQQYGIVKSVEHFDHGAITVQENMVFNAESGDILLSRTSNEFEDNTYDLKYPAYFAYPDMGPAYVTAGYEIAGTAFIASPHPYIQVSSNTNLNFGDELLVTYDVNSSTVRRKLWIDSVGASTRIYVAPRFKSSGYGSTQSTTFPDWSTGATVNNIKVKVVRPARHNTLQTLCQSAVLAQNPDEGSINSLFGTAAAYQKILSVSGSRFSDSMGRFTKVLNNKVYQDNLKYLNASSHYLNDLNEFVTGIRGNYRANETYASIYGRDYSKNHIRYDGAFAAHAFWVLVNAQTLLAKNSGLYEYFPGSNAHCTSEYARPSYITNVDVYGNVLEEVNMMSQKVAAQYGYNHQLPVAVAANARHSEFFFENFESYSLLTNGKMRGLWRKTGLLFTPFASVFDTVRPISGFYTNVSGSATNNLNESSYDIIRNMQAYNFMDRRAISANLQR